jgi:YVTN family beta-propeller protein
VPRRAASLTVTSPKTTALLAAALAQVTLAMVACTSDGNGEDRGSEPGRPSPSVTATVEVGQGALSVAVTPDGRFAYTANQSDVSVIDLSTNAVVATLRWQFLSVPKEIEFSADGRQAYVAGGTIGGSVSLVDTAGPTVTATIPVDGGSVNGLALSPDGQRVHVANVGEGMVTVDVRSRAMKARTQLPDGVRDSIAISPDGRHVYVASSADRNLPDAPEPVISVVDTATNRVSATVGLDGRRVGDLAISPDGRRIYVAHYPWELTDANVVSVIDTASNTVTATMPIKGRSSGLALAPDGRTLYVVGSETAQAQAISIETGQVSATVPIGPSATGIAIAPTAATPT